MSSDQGRFVAASTSTSLLSIPTPDEEENSLIRSSHLLNQTYLAFASEILLEHVVKRRVHCHFVEHIVIRIHR